MANNSASYYLPFDSVRTIGLILSLLCLLNHLTVLQATPISANEYSGDVTAETSTNESTENTTSSDLYVIRAVVYEIGVLTDADNTTDNNTERHEKVNLSFYDPPHKDNGLLDLDEVSPSDVISNDSKDDNDMPPKENMMNV